MWYVSIQSADKSFLLIFVSDSLFVSSPIYFNAITPFRIASIQFKLNCRTFQPHFWWFSTWKAFYFNFHVQCWHFRCHATHTDANTFSIARSSDQLLNMLSQFHTTSICLLHFRLLNFDRFSQLLPPPMNMLQLININFTWSIYTLISFFVGRRPAPSLNCAHCSTVIIMHYAKCKRAQIVATCVELKCKGVY